MRKLFFDTNVILDHLFGRRFHNEAVALLKLCERGEIEGYISTASIYTITYFVQRAFLL